MFLDQPTIGVELPAAAVARLKARGWDVGQGRVFDTRTGTTSPGARPTRAPCSTSTTRRHGTGISSAISSSCSSRSALLSPFAAVAAWYLNRRIVKPVQQVAEASVVLADGGTPMAIPTKAPQELSVMAQSFNRMARKLKKAQDTERDFLMSVGHELKTPLTAIDGYAELLQDGAVEPKEAADVLSAESGRLRRLITDLLDLARIDRSEFTVVDEPVDLAVTAREAVARFAGLAGTLGVALDVDAAEPAPARGDAGRLLQVASNLVENALRATSSGGRVEVVARPGRLSVRDTGPGLTEKDLDHAFERFYLHRKYSAGPAVGTGLGLAIVKDLTEAMGGSVEVESEPGAGARSRSTCPFPCRSPSRPTPDTEPTPGRWPRVPPARRGPWLSGSGDRPSGRPTDALVSRPAGAPCDNRSHDTGPSSHRSTLAVLAALACALLGASAWLPAAASAAGSSGRRRPPGPVTPAPPVLDDLMGRGGRRGRARAPHRSRRPARRPRDRRVRRRPRRRRRRLPRERRQHDDEHRGLVGADAQGRRRSCSKVQNALDWWNARSPDGSLELFLPAAGAYGAPQTLATGYEPIRMDVKYGWEGRQRALRRRLALGGDGRARLRPRRAGRQAVSRDALRRQDPPAERRRLGVRPLRGRQPQGRGRHVPQRACVAYTADLFGPYCMLTYDNDGYRFANFDAVLAHEMGHVFGALDEYAPPGAGLPEHRRPALRLPRRAQRQRRERRVHATCRASCAVRNGTLNAFAAGDLCRWTMGQTGLRDSDADTRPDVVDTRPALLDRAGVHGPDERRGDPAGHGDRAAAQARPHQHRRVLPPRPQHQGAARRRSTAWTAAPGSRSTATDGAFGEPSEGWTLTTEPLTPGHHVLDLEATTGETAGRTRDLWAGPTPVTLELATNAAFTKTAATVAAGATVRLYVRSTERRDRWPVPRLAPVRLVRAGRRQDRQARVTTGENGVWTGTHQAGAERRLRGALRRRRPVPGPAASAARDHHRQVAARPHRLRLTLP